MAKRANNEGSVYEDKPRGRWIGEVWLDDKRRRCSGRTKAEAAAKLRDLIQGHGQTGVVMDGHASVAGLVELWQERNLAGRKCAPRTRHRFEWHCRLIVEHLGATRLRKLTADDVERKLLRPLSQPAPGRKAQGRASLISLRSTLGQVLRFGMGRGLVTHNAALIAELPADAAEETRGQSMSLEDAPRLYEAAGHHPRLGAMWQVQLALGLRPGEVAGLLWSSVKLDGRAPSLTISRGVQTDVRGAAVLVDGVKTDGSYRTLALPSFLVPVLRAHRAAQREAQLAAPRWDNPDLVFSTGEGRVLNPANVRRDLGKLCRSLGLPPVKPNGLRHTAASVMLARGMTRAQVARVLGHESTRMLDQHYAHDLYEAVDDHLATVEAVYGS